VAETAAPRRDYSAAGPNFGRWPGFGAMGAAGPLRAPARPLGCDLLGAERAAADGWAPPPTPRGPWPALATREASGRLQMTTGFGICPQCGTPLVARAQFCGGCGRDISALTAAPAVPIAPPPWNAPVQPNTLYQEPPAPPAWPGSPDQQYPPSYPGAPYPGSQYPGAPYSGSPYPGSPYPGAYGQPRTRSNTGIAPL